MNGRKRTADERRAEQEEVASNSATTTAANDQQPQTARRGGRVKRARDIYDPSHQPIPRAPRTAPEVPVRSRQPSREPRRAAAGSQSQPEAGPSSANGGARHGSQPTQTKKSTAAAVKATESESPSASAAAQSPLMESPNIASGQPECCLLCHSLDEHLASVVCAECRVSRVHLDCLADTSDFHAEAEEAGWLCDQCRTCCVCYEPNVMHPIYTCFSCNNNYHEACHTGFDASHAPLGHIYKPLRIRCAECRQQGLDAKREQLYWLQQREHDQRQIRRELAAKAVAAAADAPKPSQQLPHNRSSDFAGFTSLEADRQSPNRTMLIALLPPTPSPPLPPKPSSATASSTATGAEQITGLRLISPPTTTEDEAAERSNSADCAEMQRLLQRMAPFVSLVEGRLRLDSAPVPDCRDWSKERLHKYLGRYLEACVVQPLLDEEIDGQALLLLTRKQVLKLPGDGRLLELWAHVQRLQKRSNRVVLAL